MTLQGPTKEEALARPFSSSGKASNTERLVTYVASESRDVAIDTPLAHPGEKHVYKLGRRMFPYRDDAHDFACATYHIQPGLRIRLQELPDLLTADGARFVCSIWPGYRVSQGEIRTMQHRLYDCLRQQRLPEPFYGSEATIALKMSLVRNANSGKMDAPFIRH